MYIKKAWPFSLRYMIDHVNIHTLYDTFAGNYTDVKSGIKVSELITEISMVQMFTDRFCCKTKIIGKVAEF